MAIYEYRDEAGGRIRFEADYKQNQESPLLVRTAASEPLGQLHCFWESTPARAFLREIFSYWIEAMRPGMRSDNSSEPIDEDEAQRIIDQILDHASTLLKNLAPAAFAEAQFKLITEVIYQTLQIGQLVEPDENGVERARLWVDLSHLNQLREEILKDLRKTYNREMGIRPGRPSDGQLPDGCIDYCEHVREVIIEVKKLLRRGGEIEQITLDEQFAELRLYPELMAQVGHEQPKRLARAYASRKFGLHSGDALDHAIRAKKTRK
jgi:hypothetical protein